MENVGNAITCCFEMMKKMYETPPQQQQPVSRDSLQPKMPAYPEVRHIVSISFFHLTASTHQIFNSVLISEAITG